MFHYQLEKKSGQPVYLQLIDQIRTDILRGLLPGGTKLPSKRTAAADLGVSVVTVKNAYEQLLAEGYILSSERKGYYVADINGEQYHQPERQVHKKQPVAPVEKRINLASGGVSSGLFPMSVWMKLSRSVYLEYGKELLKKAPYNGHPLLRDAISAYLYQLYGISVDPERILVTSGNEHVYNTLETFFGDDRVYGIEDPGHRTIASLYGQHGARVEYLSLDEKGVTAGEVRHKKVQILHISPSHHFPTGITMPASRRSELLAWAGEAEDRFIIEDEYDSEFRMAGKPIPPLLAVDQKGKVIYINTFTKTIAPSLRIGYAVLPQVLADRYREKMGFLSCTVPVAEQLILAKFMSDGYLSRHVHRMRTYYRHIRDKLLRSIEEGCAGEEFSVSGVDSGLHFLLHVRNGMPEDEMKQILRENGVDVRFLSDYTAKGEAGADKALVISYADLAEEQIPDLIGVLRQIAGGDNKKEAD
ncbi:MAG: PLP-dependent aminotransferase family protein [Clostridia bacterium]|nr:PLP-dependent aminotransferase family protein [Clostridia bacterium]